MSPTLLPIGYRNIRELYRPKKGNTNKNIENRHRKQLVCTIYKVTMHIYEYSIVEMMEQLEL